MTKVLIAADHGGISLKKQLISELSHLNFEFIDLGTHDEKSVDYPDYAKKLCQEVINKKADYGILICGSGQGMAMSANRHKNIRAALCWDIPSAKLSREHNNANVLCLGARLIPFGLAIEIARTWLSTPFAGGRHKLRTEKMEC
ncbi:MAG: ribose 5-phosphate isomerase B [Oligoflexia bacterium]|nr:ribose 5-phosphate isomerase B [Oligoflexia bacterium]